MSTRADKRRTEAEQIRSVPPSEVDPCPDVAGVLLSDKIIEYVRSVSLIEPFSKDNLKPAGYELTLGDEYFLSGEFAQLDPNSNDNGDKIVEIPPFQVAVLKTREIIRLPRYLIARWNIRVRHAYKGLLWVGGPQVDPGYVGYLFCPIYNLSDKPVKLEIGEPIALIDFVKTTKFDSDKPEEELLRYRFPPKRMALEDFEIDDYRSALFTHASQRLDDFQDRVRILEARFFAFTSISFAIFGIVIGVIGLTSRANVEDASLSAGFFGAATIASASAALLIAGLSYVRGRAKQMLDEHYSQVLAGKWKRLNWYMRGAWHFGLVTVLAIAVVMGGLVYFAVQPGFSELRQGQVLTRSDIAPLSDDLKGLDSRLARIEESRVTQADLNAIHGELDALRAELSPAQGK